MMNEKQVSVGSRPHHVRKLQFGQVLLNLDSGYGECGQDKNGRLIIDDGTSRIPSMSRIDYVQKWISTHVIYPADEPADNVLLIDDFQVDHSNFASDSICPIENDPGSSRAGKLKKGYAQFIARKEYVDDNENVERPIARPDHLPLQPKDVNIQSSPILGKGQIRRKYTRFSHQRNNRPKCNYDKNNSTEIRVESEANPLKDSMEGPPVKRSKRSLSSNENDHEWLTYSQTKVVFESPNVFNIGEIKRVGYSEEEAVIEEGSSSDARSKEHGNATHLSMIIDDSDTEEHGCHVDALSPCNLSPCTVKSRDLDVTYFSNAENLGPPPSMLHFSQSISSATPATNQHSDSIVISAEASPTRTPSDSRVLLQVMDSGRKKKKPKRGSLVERLQSLINSEKSSVRIWRHCLKHLDKEDVNNPYVTIHVQSCTLRFDKQLLNGIVLEDFASLLPPLDFVGNSESSQTHQRDISILITPEMAGKIEITSKCIMQIAPPWILLDRKDLFLAVSYMTFASFHSTTGLTMEKSSKALVDKYTSLRTFHCLCNLDSGTFDDYNTVCRQCIGRSNEPNVLASVITDE